jgi:hypothetical protein
MSVELPAWLANGQLTQNVRQNMPLCTYVQLFMFFHLLKSAMTFGLQRVPLSPLSFCAFPTWPINPSAVAPTGLADNTLTLVFSVACSLFACSKYLRPFIINTLQPLFPKHPGGGGDLLFFKLRLPTFNLLYLRHFQESGAMKASG